MDSKHSNEDDTEGSFDNDSFVRTDKKKLTSDNPYHDPWQDFSCCCHRKTVLEKLLIALHRDLDEEVLMMMVYILDYSSLTNSLVSLLVFFCDLQTVSCSRNDLARLCIWQRHARILLPLDTQYVVPHTQHQLTHQSLKFDTTAGKTRKQGNTSDKNDTLALLS